LRALEISIRRYEERFGAIEEDASPADPGQMIS
jgi:hypothetical protein